MNNRELIDKLVSDRNLSREEWIRLLDTYTDEDREYAAEHARRITEERFGKNVYFRGIIEFSNICRNDCIYCGIRRSNKNAVRYRLTPDEIMLCCEEGYRLGYRTFVLQSGEDAFWTDEKITNLIRRIKDRYPDCAVTLSIGELSRESCQAMFDAGADRYLLRHETANEEHYGKLHPSSMSLKNRLECLNYLKDIGFQTGCGMMTGAPYQTSETLADDMLYMHEFQPAMAGIGPFIPHSDTPFADQPAGSTELTLFLLSLTRIMLPNALIPSTTALGSTAEDGRIKGVLAGCNIVMPNLSPQNVRKNYMLYNNKAGTESDAEESLNQLRDQMQSIGRKVVVDRGDHIDYIKK